MDYKIISLISFLFIALASIFYGFYKIKKEKVLKKPVLAFLYLIQIIIFVVFIYIVTKRYLGGSNLTNNNFFFKFGPLLIIIPAGLFDLYKAFSKSKKIFYWHLLAYLVLLVFMSLLYLNFNLAIWQVQVMFCITLVLIVFVAYKANKAEQEHKKKSRK
ncbi:MAG: hypothetical protein U5L76_01550 [Patescibacteria group bacterium]|nr:hypothetical protein [Patescibacteria group bacterium]